MNLQSFDLIPRAPSAMDASMVSTFARCPSRFYLQYVLGRVPKARTIETTGALDWGSCWHKVMYALHTEGPDAAALVVEEEYPQYISPEFDRMKRSKQRMLEALSLYVKDWEKDREKWERLEDEMFFDITSEDGMRWSGRIDSVRRSKQSGRIYLVDYKTTSALGQNYYEMYEMSFQLQGYAWAATQIFGEPVQEVVLDVFYITSKLIEFYKKTLYFSMDRLEEWKNQTKMWIEKIHEYLEKYLEDPDKWPQNRNSCIDFGRCPYYDVHSIIPGETRLRLLSHTYEERRWDPYARD